MLGAFAEATERVEIGALVTCNSYRNPYFAYCGVEARGVPGGDGVTEIVLRGRGARIREGATVH